MAHEFEELLPLRVCSCVAFHRVNAQIVGFVSRDSFKLVFSFSQASSSLCDLNSSTKLKTRKQRPQTSTSMLANSSWAAKHQVHVFMVNFIFFFGFHFFISVLPLIIFACLPISVGAISCANIIHNTNVLAKEMKMNNLKFCIFNLKTNKNRKKYAHKHTHAHASKKKSTVPWCVYATKWQR